ncbi:carbohydrate ABC transporter permease [Paenibacillus sp. N4]|uniref:carbohydrate ABC transporter permease n=1 Tax=Paenibacillus vietnamensis TaxID=2590547 RepID=UPI001CD0AB9C|nr:carbohydrate ABC transporter permease [Paenibacillus vietnamensis]MCA0755895.1 carbohydrate ABC transporter permease [Paenibacillus vietnamensis]
MNAVEAVAKPAASKEKRRTFDVLEALIYLFAVMMLILIVYPIYFIVIASFSDPAAVAGGRMWVLPMGFTLDGYQELLKHSNIWIGYKNTILYTVIGTLISLAVNVSAAYALSRKDLAGRKAITLFFIFTMFFNGGLIPTFLTIRDFHLYDTFLVMVLPFSVAVFNIIVARTFFQSSIPGDLWEAAQLDGCGNLKYYVQIVLPLSKAVLSVLALWTAVGYWNSYFNALIYLKDQDLYPLQLILRNILITNQMQSSMGTGEAAVIAMRLANLMRYSVIIVSTLPIMCMYPFVQKYFNQGVMIGAVK